MNGAHPALFLIGAPKCGTTSLADWLAGHPDIDMARPKEPGFHAPDVASSPAARTREAYLALFPPPAPGRLRGEASTSYLRSRLAVPRILAERPDARFVVCLRNPVEMAPSVHGQLVRSGREPIADFETAWAMQARRRSAPVRRHPGHNPDDWQYAEMCRLGAQVAALLERAPRAQVHFVFLDDLKAAPRATYARVLAFAGLPDDGRSSFPVLNRRRVPRMLALARASHLAGSLRQHLGLARGTGLGARLNRLNERAPGAAALSARMRRELADTFRDDIRLLARLTGRDLDPWLAAGAAA